MSMLENQELKDHGKVKILTTLATFSMVFAVLSFF